MLMTKKAGPSPESEGVFEAADLALRLEREKAFEQVAAAAARTTAAQPSRNRRAAAIGRTPRRLSFSSKEAVGCSHSKARGGCRHQQRKSQRYPF
jgi:hypothetical protein